MKPLPTNLHPTGHWRKIDVDKLNGPRARRKRSCGDKISTILALQSLTSLEVTVFRPCYACGGQSLVAFHGRWICLVSDVYLRSCGNPSTFCFRTVDAGIVCHPDNLSSRRGDCCFMFLFASVSGLRIPRGSRRRFTVVHRLSFPGRSFRF